MSREWFITADLSGLPGLPSTPRGINKMSVREGWKNRKRAKGKGSEYHINSLPPETQQHLRHQHAIAVVNEKISDSGEALATQELKRIEAERNGRLQTKEQSLKDFSALPDGPKKTRAKARKWVIDALNIYRRAHGGTKQSSRQQFAQAFNDDSLDAAIIQTPAWVREQMPKHKGIRTLTAASLHRWEDDLYNKGIMALVDNYGQNKGRSKIEGNETLKKLVLGSIFKYPHITAKKIKAYIEAGHPDLDIVSIKGIDRYIKAWKADNAQLWTKITNPDQWKNIYMAAVGSHHDHITRPNQLWELDSTPGDWMLTDGRHSVVGVIDMYTRRLKLYVSKTSKATAVCQVFRRATIAWGLAEAIRTDNGKDYVSNQIEAVTEALEVMHEVCIPFASEEKGTIERAMRTLSHGILDLLPGFIGHNVAERKVIEARKAFAQRIMDKDSVVDVQISSDELQVILDQWTDHVYMHDVHGGLDGKTPFQVASSWTKPVRRISDERVLDMLLAEVAATRTITKKGIKFNKRWYFTPHLFDYAGEEATIRYDEQDIGRLAVYIQSNFIGWAECPELTGTSRREAATAIKAHQKKFLAEQAKQYTGYKKQLTDDIPQVVLQHRIEQSKKLHAFPPQSTEHTTAAIASVLGAEAPQQPAAPELTAREKEIRQQISDNTFKPVVLDIADAETPQARYRRWARIAQQIENGEPVSDELKAALARYQQSSGYQMMKDFFEELGLPIGEAN